MNAIVSKPLLAGDKRLRDKAFNVAKNPKCNGYKRGLTSMVYKYFDKIFSGRAIKMDLCLVKN